jgi:hypothetical protein
MLQIYQQKVKHLLYEQQNNITTLKADTELALKLQQDEFAKRQAELNRDKRALKQELREQVGGARQSAVAHSAHIYHTRRSAAGQPALQGVTPEG